MTYRKQAIIAVDQVRSEYRVAAWAVARSQHDAEVDPTILHLPQIELSEIRRCSMELEASYFVRLFAVFESNLRQIWEQAMGRDTHPPVRDLLDGCAARQAVPDDILEKAHRVRIYRNSLVHGGEAARVTLGDARQYLCTFLGRMPPVW